LFTASVFASDSIDVSISNSEVVLWDTLQYTIKLDMNESEWEQIAIEVPGIEYFQIFSQSRSYNYENINGVTNGVLQYTLDLIANNQGDFTLWPVKILSWSGEILDDKIIQILVSEVTQIPDTQKQDLWEEQSESRELKPNRGVAFPWWGILCMLTLLFSIAYIIFQMLNKSWEEEKSWNKNIESQESETEKLKKYFNTLNSDIDNLESQIFFKKYNTWIRHTLMLFGIANAHKITLSELTAFDWINANEIYKIFKKSYKYEYSDKSVSLETRKKYISDILSQLNK
jgi:hypothetical protein